MLMPRKTKFRKQQRGRRRGSAKGQQQVNFGEFGLKSLETAWVTNRQIEAARIAMTRKIKRGGKVWINVFPDKPVTQKPAETRMGSGKGSPEHWVAVVDGRCGGLGALVLRFGVLLLCHRLYVSSRSRIRSFWTVRMRAMSRLAPRTRALFSSAPVAAWKRRLKSSCRVEFRRRTSSSSARSRSSLVLTSDS